jgi:hypothetical protein
MGSMKKITKGNMISLAIILMMMGFIFSGCIGSSSGPNSAKSLMKEYQRNKLAFTMKYLGKTIAIHGEISKIGSGLTGPFLSLKTVNNSDILCQFGLGDETVLEKYQKGKEISVKGLVIDSPTKTVFMLNYCDVVNGKETEKDDQKLGNPVKSLSAEELTANFENDTVEAISQFGGKVIQVSGTVIDFKKESVLTTVSVKGELDSKVECIFRNTDGSIPELKNGQAVNIVGKVVSESFGYVTLYKCQLK